MASNGKRLYTLNEIEEFGIIPFNRNKLNQMSRRRDFPKIRIAKSILVDLEGLYTWIDEHLDSYAKQSEVIK